MVETLDTVCRGKAWKESLAPWPEWNLTKHINSLINKLVIQVSKLRLNPYELKYQWKHYLFL